MKTLALFFWALAVSAAGASGASGRVPVVFDWSSAAPLPPARPGGAQPGAARPFAGFDARGRFFFAGGSWFAGRPDGTRAKTVGDAVYVFEAGAWRVAGRLPEPLAEGGSAATPAGLFCVGGRTLSGAATGRAFLLRLDGRGRAVCDGLPPLPVTVTLPAAAADRGTVYIVAGRQNGALSRRVWSFDAAAGASGRWRDCGEIPGPAREQAAAAVQNGDQKRRMLAVFGGSGLAADGRPDSLADGWGLPLSGDGRHWRPLAAPPGRHSAIGAALLPCGDQHLLLIGGYGAEGWHKANRGFTSRDPAALGWQRELLAYHMVTDTWCVYGRLPDGVPPRCGAGAGIGPGNRIILAGGEIAPALRTPDTQTAAPRKTVRFPAQGWAVVALYFALMAGMAAWFIRKKKTADDYFRGGHRIPWFVTGMSIFATMLSSITFISIPTMTYLSDWRYFPMALCIPAVAPVAVFFFLPFFCRLKITSAYEYLERRFNLGVRLFGSAAFIVFMICRAAIVTLLPALALNAVTGLGVDACILICGALTIVFCSLGGLEAVIWSDFVQGVILLGGALLALGVLVMRTEGGPAGCRAIASAAGKTRMWDFRWLLTEPVLWVVLVQGVVSNLSSYTSDQCVVQRYIATTDEAAARRSIWFNGALSVLASLIFYACGTALYTHYKSFPALMDVTLPKSDSVFPLFLALELPGWMSGLVIAAIFSATISTLSTNLSSAATALTADFALRFRPDMPGERQVRWGAVFTAAVGVLGILAALALARLETRSLFDNFQKFIAMLTSGLTGLFFMGVFLPRVRGAAAVAGLAANYAVCFALEFLPMPFVKPHPFLTGGIGLAVCIGTAYLLSFVTKSDGRDLAGLTLRALRPSGSTERTNET